MAGRRPRATKPSGVPAGGKASAAGQSKRRAKRPTKPVDDKDAEIARLTQELTDAQARLRDIEERGIDAFTVGKIDALLEAAQVARGQALEAAVARNKAEADLRALERAIAEARGPTGWLLRRAARRLRP